MVLGRNSLAPGSCIMLANAERPSCCVDGLTTLDREAAQDCWLGILATTLYEHELLLTQGSPSQRGVGTIAEIARRIALQQLPGACLCALSCYHCHLQHIEYA